MLHIGSLREGLVVFKALGSQTRIGILDWLGLHGPANAGELSEALRISPGALTPHLRLLMDAGLVRADAVSGKHGVQKVLSLAEDKILLEFVRGRRDVNVLETEIGVGQYTKCEIYPTCGLACSRFSRTSFNAIFHNLRDATILESVQRQCFRDQPFCI